MPSVIRRRVRLVVSVALGLAAPMLVLAPAPARAQMAVIDVNAIMQLARQVSYWRDQLRAMSGQLAQLQSTHDALTGGRGMERALEVAPAARAYLPGDVRELGALGEGGGAYAALAAELQRLVEAGAVLDGARLAALDPADRARIEREREAGARVRVLMGRAYAETSARFAGLQRLIDAIPAAADPKAIGELQGRIAAEQAMLANEQSKLFALQALAQAEAQAAETARRERAVAAHGRFETRFRPGVPGS